MYKKTTMLFTAAVVAAGLTFGCDSVDAPKLKEPFATLPPKKDFPEFLRGTILERMDHTNPDPSRVSNYGFVANLPGTGDGTAPSAVRDYIVKEMSRHGFGMASSNEWAHVSPEKMIDDPGRRNAIVRVDGFMHPGIRKGEWFDVMVSALPDSGVTSLANGNLYTTDLKFGGADTMHPEGIPGVAATAKGTLFVNPDVALNPQSSLGEKTVSRLSRREAVILDGGMATQDQPLIMRLRAPQRSVMRQIEARINQQWPGPKTAEAKNEAIMHLTVPVEFRGDWERFIGVATHLYLDGRPEVLAQRARDLALEAMKKDAPLSDISFAWEGMGEAALPSIIPLMNARYAEDVQFAAARAAAFIGDPSAPNALVRIASTPGHQFQSDAVRALGGLRTTPGVERMLNRLVDSDSALVRVEAYRVLAARKSAYVVSTFMPKPDKDERFILDQMPGESAPLIYASRSGLPRLAILGRKVRIQTPITFRALDDRLTITSARDSNALTVFYRPAGGGLTVKVQSRPDVGELVGWLGGYALEPDQQINLTYAEIVAVVQSLSDKKCLVPAGAEGTAVSFVLQQAQETQDLYAGAPPLVPRGRPQSETLPGFPTSRQASPVVDK